MFRSYDVTLPEFQGPLDLLLTLIEKKQLDITKVSLLAVTDQYLEALRSQERIDADALADFLVIAAKLLLIKSRSLLPTEAPAVEGEEDPGEQLAQLLLEYKRVKELALELRQIEESGQRSYPRLAPLAPPESPRTLEPISASELYRALQQVLARLPAEPTETVAKQAVTIDHKIALMEELLAGASRLSFDKVLRLASSRLEVILSFLALLELLKRDLIKVFQEELFGEILIERKAQEPAEAAEQA